MTLLSKLDRNKEEPGSSQCVLIKSGQHDATQITVRVHAVEDNVLYKDRPPGDVHPLDDPW